MINKQKPTHRRHHKLHDYKSRCIYHITLVVSDRMPLFGRMVGETVDVARVEFTPLGQEIANAIQMIPMMEERKGNDVQILGAATMPEHIHFVLFVRKPMKEKLGLIIRGFKQGCNKALRGWLKKAGGEVIKLYKAPLTKKSHPRGTDIDHCAQGQMLVLGPWEIPDALQMTARFGSADSKYAQFHTSTTSPNASANRSMTWC